MGVPKNGWFIREYPIRMDDLETPISFLGDSMLVLSWDKPMRYNISCEPTCKKDGRFLLMGYFSQFFPKHACGSRQILFLQIRAVQSSSCRR